MPTRASSNGTDGAGGTPLEPPTGLNAAAATRSAAKRPVQPPPLKAHDVNHRTSAAAGGAEGVTVRVHNPLAAGAAAVAVELPANPTERAVRLAVARATGASPECELVVHDGAARVALSAEPGRALAALERRHPVLTVVPKLQSGRVGRVTPAMAALPQLRRLDLSNLDEAKKALAALPESAGRVELQLMAPGAGGGPELKTVSLTPAELLRMLESPDVAAMGPNGSTGTAGGPTPTPPFAELQRRHAEAAEQCRRGERRKAENIRTTRALEMLRDKADAKLRRRQRRRENKLAKQPAGGGSAEAPAAPAGAGAFGFTQGFLGPSAAAAAAAAEPPPIRATPKARGKGGAFGFSSGFLL